MQLLSTLAILATSAIGVLADGWTEQFFSNDNCTNPPFMNISGSAPVTCMNLAFGSCLPVSAVYDYSITAWTGANCTGTGIGDKDDGSEGIYCVNPGLAGNSGGFNSYSIAST